MVGVQVAMSLSFSVSVPFLPLLLEELGIHPESSVVAWAGVIGSSFALTATLVTPFWGMLADRTGRKAMVVRTCIAASLFNALVGLAQNEWELLAVRTIAGIFGGFSAASMALVGTQVPEERLGYSLGWLMTGQLIGNLLGPFIGGVLADAFHDYRIVFFSTAAGALLATIACVAFVEEHDFKIPAAGDRKREPWWKQMAALRHNQLLLPLFAVVTLAQIAARGASPMIPLFVHQLLGTSPWLGTAAGAAVAVTGIADVIASPWLGKRSDLLGYRRVLVISLAGAAAFTFPQGWATNIWIFLALRFGVGIFIGGILPSATAWIGRLFPREQRGQVYGLTSSANFFGGFLGPLLAGFTTARFGFAATFVEIGALLLANLVFVAVATRGKPEVTAAA
jgi:MFS transporter, DHA1 family, multidrug resistance protein